jgi:hypothetical protein
MSEDEDDDDDGVAQMLKSPREAEDGLFDVSALLISYSQFNNIHDIR